MENENCSGFHSSRRLERRRNPPQPKEQQISMETDVYTKKQTNLDVTLEMPATLRTHIAVYIMYTRPRWFSQSFVFHWSHPHMHERKFLCAFSCRSSDKRAIARQDTPSWRASELLFVIWERWSRVSIIELPCGSGKIREFPPETSKTAEGYEFRWCLSVMFFTENIFSLPHSFSFLSKFKPPENSFSTFEAWNSIHYWLVIRYKIISRLPRRRPLHSDETGTKLKSAAKENIKMKSLLLSDLQSQGWSFLGNQSEISFNVGIRSEKNEIE